MSSDVWRVSPQRIDPLSWFTRPLVPLGFAAMALIFGSSVLFATWRLSTRPWLDVAAILLIAAACVSVQISTRPLRPAFGPRQAVVPLVLTLVALGLSTASGLDSTVLAQHWWAPIGVGFVVATLGPYSSVRETVVYGGILTVATGVCGAVAFVMPKLVWPPLSVVVITGSSVIVATVATSIFSWVIVSSTQRLLAGAGTEPEPPAGSDEAARRVERRTLARLGTRVAPFLESVADAGVVTDADRALAGQLARRLRSDLVSQANRSWLDRVALFGRISVVDPDARADRMNAAQRTALRALLMAVMDHPAATAGSLFIELRGEPDGSTAVALSLDLALPRGVAR